jgi:hypothetical protein
MTLTLASHRGLRGVGLGNAGVYWHSLSKRWMATLKVIAGDGTRKTTSLGGFVKEVDAALAYDQAAREHHGDKAQLNFPDLPPQPQVVPTKQGATSGQLPVPR